MNVNRSCYKKLNTPSAIQKIMTSSANISFGGGWGDHLPPDNLLHAFESVFSSPSKYYESTRYSDIAGNKEFRNTVAEFENRMYGRKNIELSNVIIGQGSTELTSCLFKVLLENNDNVLLFDPSYANFKSQLIEWSQKYKKEIKFETTEESTHKSKQPKFVAIVELDNKEIGKGIGASKKEAQQNAARQTLKKLEVI